jgi:DNA-directed RNA polymerase specialized sigma24 family protein
VDTGHQIEIDGLRRAARISASIAGAAGAEVDEIAEEAIARLLLQDGLVNNPKAWVRRTARRLAVQAHARQRIQADDVLRELSTEERRLVVRHRAGYSVRELAKRHGLTEEDVSGVLADADRKIRRPDRWLARIDG